MRSQESVGKQVFLTVQASHWEYRTTLLALFGLFGVFPLTVRAQQDTSLNAILAAWKARQESVKSLRFSWSARETRPAGTIVRKNRPAGATTSEDRVPPEDATFDASYQLSLDGDRMKYHYNGMIWSGPRGVFVPQDYLSVYDGADSKLFWPKNAPGNPQGVIRGENHNLEVKNINAKPILLSYRAAHPVMGLRKKFRMSGKKGEIAGCECLILEEEPDPLHLSSSLVTLWVAPNRDYAILRYCAGTSAEDIRTKIDIQYKQGPQGGFVPSSWEVVRCTSNNGELKESSSAVVTDAELNVELPPQEFQLDFPPDTMVIDLKTDPSSMTSYIVREGGGKRALTPEERIHATYEQALETETGEALRARPSLTMKVMWVALSVLCVLAVVRAAFRWRSVRKRRYPS